MLMPWVFTCYEGQGVRSMCEHMWCFPHEIFHIYMDMTTIEFPQHNFHPFCTTSLHSCILPSPPLFPVWLKFPLAQLEMVQRQLAQALDLLHGKAKVGPRLGSLWGRSGPLTCTSPSARTWSFVGSTERGGSLLRVYAREFQGLQRACRCCAF